MMMQYKALELHTHTLHSDGQFTVSELCEHAKKDQYAGIALTDHNTISGHRELTPALMEKTLPIVKGIEWTTFYGHMLVLNTSTFIDWRDANEGNIDACMRKLREIGAVAGIAHPFCPGNPVCTGCHWDYTVKDWRNVSFMEVWSKPFPNKLYINQLAYEMWTTLLNKGFRIAATYGRDWHAADAEPTHAACTYLGIEGDITGDSVADAIRNCRSYVTAGPCMEVVLTQGGKVYGLGDTIAADTADIHILVNETERREQWERFSIHTRRIWIVHNGEILHEAQGMECHLPLNPAPGWIRAEIYGEYMGNESLVLLGFTSPVFVQ